MNPFIPVSCIILSAGSSGRMGTHKALLKFDENTTFLEKITTEYLAAGIEKIIVVVSGELHKELIAGKLVFPETVQLVINNKPESGRFHSLQTGVKHIKQDNYCFFQNIDNPFITVGLLYELITLKQDAEVIIPVFQDMAGHPVLLSPLVTRKILQANETDLRIDLFLREFKMKRINTSDERILVNINSLNEYYSAGFKG